MKISVITTLFNYARYIEDAIQSFLKQGVDDCEMIIVDDGSTDNPYAVISPYLSPNISYLNLGQNFGYSYAKNVGIRAAKADVLVMLDADDMLTSGSLFNRYGKLKEGFDFVHGPVWDTKNGQQSLSSQWKKWRKSKQDASCYRYIHAQSVMLKKDIHRKIGLYDESLLCKSDREMWARIMNHGFKVGYVETPVAVYRIHNKQMSRSKKKLAINEQLQANVLKKIEIRKTDLHGLVMLP